MAVDEKTLAEHHEIIHISCQSNTQISAKATKIISALSAPTEPTTTTNTKKSALIILTAHSRWANKLISIVEIAKRDLEAKGVKVFQYNALSSEIVEVERKPRPKGVGAAPAVTEDGDGSEDEAFQTMGAGEEEGGVKKRSVPVMTTYLTTQAVKALRVEFG
jgi:hypothetical protein